MVKEHDIAPCLPSYQFNDKLQPLDISLFASMKATWCKQQKSYADQDPSSSLLLKTEFPRMLKKLIKCLNMEELLPKAKNHMKLKAIYN
jgi:hypothetical protein